MQNYIKVLFLLIVFCVGGNACGQAKNEDPLRFKDLVIKDEDLGKPIKFHGELILVKKIVQPSAWPTMLSFRIAVIRGLESLDDRPSFQDRQLKKNQVVPKFFELKYGKERVATASLVKEDDSEWFFMEVSRVAISEKKVNLVLYFEDFNNDGTEDHFEIMFDLVKE